MPLKDERGDFNGVVALNLSLERLSTVLRTIAGDHLDLRLYDATGQLIAASGPLIPLDPTYRLDPGEAVPPGLFRDPEGRAWVATSLFLPRTGWRILVRRPADEALATLYMFRRGLLLLLTLVLISGFGFWYLLTHQALRPLEAIARFSRELGEHPGSASAAPILRLTARGDQIGHLARSLLWMQAAIERRLSELRTLLDTGRVVLSSLETEAVIATILEQIQRLLRVPTCALFTLDERTGRYRVRAVRGLSPDYARGLSFHPDDPRSPTMRAIRTGRPVQIADIEVEGYPELRERARREGFRSLLAVPLQARHVPPAALVIYRPDPHPFSEDEVSLAWNFANLAAFALEHAVLYARSDMLLQQQTRRLETLIEHLHDGLIMESREREILYMNRRAAEWCGLEEPCAPGCSADIAYAALLPHLSPSEEAARLLEGTDEGTVEVRWQRDARARELRIQSLPVRGEGEERLGRILVLRDITVERELDRAKSALLSAVSHELRTPLTKIKLALELLRRTPLNEKQRQYHDIALQECEAEIQLINRLLDLQGLEGKDLGSAVAAIDLPHLWHSLIESVQQCTQARSLTLQVGDLPPSPWRFYSHRQLLTQILKELLDNACKFTQPGGTIRLEVQPIPEGVEFRIGNTAQIPPDQLPRLFERFYRVPTADPWAQPGSGLGLALVKQWVERLQGHIRVTSEAGWTCFLLRLPSLKPSGRT